MKAALAVATALAAVVMASPVAAQVDFSGTWQLDREASEFPQFGDGGRGGRGGGRRGLGGGAATLAITQSDAVLTIEQQSDRGNRTMSYHLDGRESTSPGPRGGEWTTRSEWDGATLITEGTMEMSTPRGDFSLEFIERRTLSDDAQRMTVESTRTIPRGEMTTRLVYARSPV